MTVERIQLWRSWGRHPLVIAMLGVSALASLLDVLDPEHVTNPLTLAPAGVTLYLSWVLIAAPIVALIGTYVEGPLAGCVLELIGWANVALVFTGVVVSRIGAGVEGYQVGSGFWWSMAVVVGAWARTGQVAVVLASFTPGGQRLLERTLR